MAEAKGERRVRNMVHDDAIWRQTINYELLTANSWEKDWGFMGELYEKTPTTTTKASPKTKLPPIYPSQNLSGLPSKLPPGLTTDQNSTLSDWLLMHDVGRIITSKSPNQKYTFPCTTMQEVGWDWEEDGEGGFKQKSIGSGSGSGSGKGDSRHRLRTLEKYGRYAEGRKDILKWWGGARESLP
ncbi:hypothetical protein HK097_003146 [Rhizophlyctis rosea]|uniref:Uncharacterized protein n=1 Tax=Rhizophlyctis rosea TaxID=64517 RepID=A0AAD5S467_9FUNG|nr:hypothetical protein HK097_003146 [Rhizophlyctis rosea]